MKSTFNNINPPSVRLGGKSSLMSLVHVLVPERIYNASTIEKEDIELVKKMTSAARLWTLYLCNIYDCRQKGHQKYSYNGY